MCRSVNEMMDMKECFDVQLSEIDMLSNIFSEAGEFNIDDMSSYLAVKAYREGSSFIPQLALRLSVKLKIKNSVS